MQSGSVLHVSGLTLQPTQPITLFNTTLQKNTTTVANFSVPHIQRAYHFTNTTSSFRGNIRFNYSNNELNGISENVLSLGIYDSSSWATYVPFSRDTLDNVVVTHLLNGIRLNELTLSNPIEVASLSIGATTLSICEGEAVTFTATPVNGGSNPSFQWKKNGVDVGTNNNTYSANDFSEGDIINCVMTSNNPNVVTTSATSNNITLSIRAKSNSITNISACTSYTWNATSYTNSGTYSYITANAAGCDSTAMLNLTILTTPPTPIISITQPGCTIPTGSFVVTSPLGASYQYSLGGNFQSSPSFTNLTPGNYSLTVQHFSSCSTSVPFVINTAPQPFTPATPDTVYGIKNVCAYIATGVSLSYSTPIVSGATSYLWTVPVNSTIISGQGTHTIQVIFNNGFITSANKQITVKAAAVCGLSSAKIFYTSAQAPMTPANIMTSSTDVCPSLGTNVPIIFKINKSLSATSYIWNTQQGTTNVVHPNGSGINDTLIAVTFNNNYTSSSINVQAMNVCGVSGTRSFLLYRNNPPTPSLISGPTNACEYIGNASNTATYSVSPAWGVIGYNWTVPQGAINLTGQGTPTISFKFPPGFNSGSISVTNNNGCGVSGVRSLSILALNPAMADIADVIMLSGCPNRMYSYTLSRISMNSTAMVWTVPNGANILSGQGSNSIIVSYPNTAVSGFVTVFGTSNCGQSVPRYTPVKLTACVSGLSEEQPIVNNKLMTSTLEEIFDVALTPNPTATAFHLKINTSSKGKITVTTSDALGRKIHLLETSAKELQFGNQWQTGVYLIEVRQGRKKKILRGVKY